MSSFMGEPTDDTRAERGRQIMEFYKTLNSDLMGEEINGNTFAIGDVIADLLHLASRNTESDGADPVERAIRLGQAHYEEESEEEEEDPGSIDDSVKCCPDCEVPNQFGEVCPICLREDSANDETEEAGS